MEWAVHRTQVVFSSGGETTTSTHIESSSNVEETTTSTIHEESSESFSTEQPQPVQVIDKVEESDPPGPSASKPYEYYPITGIQVGRGPDGSVPLRQEITEWSSKPENSKQVNLYLLALRRLQDVPPSERDSWFQIAGIHGMPYQAWDEPSTTLEEAKDKGYCVHANPLFPAWHRPYLLLLENQLYDIMVKEIIPMFPKDQQDVWQQAADTWRLPYWDWAVNPKVPKLAYDPEVTVMMPNGILTTIENPLYQFKMPNDKPMGSSGVGTIKGDENVELAYGNCYATSRCPNQDDTAPTSKTWAEGTVNNDEVAKRMTDHLAYDDKNYGAAAEMVYRLLTYPLTYPQFATVSLDESKADVQTDVNIEFIHNNIHYWVGGDGGHMSQIPVATFDGLFWLHHCNIDRIFALWQALNPDKWFTEAKQGEFDQKVIGLKDTDLVTNKTPLRPFHKDKEGNVWTPDEVRNHTDLGYSYKEIQPWKQEFQKDGVLDREKFIKDLKGTVNEKYGRVRGQAIEVLAEATKPTTPSSGQAGPAMAVAIATSTHPGSPATAIARAFSSGGPPPAPPVPGGMKVVKDGKAIESNDFALSVRFSRFAFNGHPFSINVCLAPADESQARDPERDYIGSVYNFSQPAVVDGQEVCSNCSNLQRGNTRMSSYLPVNILLNKLLKEESLKSLEKDDVEAVLKRLYWRVIKYGKEVPEDQLTALDLQVLVSVNTATHFEDPTESSGFENFAVMPSLGANIPEETEATPATTPEASPEQALSDIQYLALDKTIKLKKPVVESGAIIVESASVDLNPADVAEDSTGISFMYFDDSSDADKRDESNYDVLLSVSIRRGEGKLRLNSKPARGGWHTQDDLDIDAEWFASSSFKLEVKDSDGEYLVFINDQGVGSRKKAFERKSITHVQYWIKDEDRMTSALSYALTVKVV